MGCTNNVHHCIAVNQTIHIDADWLSTKFQCSPWIGCQVRFSLSHTGINPPYAEQFGPYSNTPASYIVQCDDQIMNVHIKWKCLIPILSSLVKYCQFQD